jgi:hypothetical protein
MLSFELSMHFETTDDWPAISVRQPWAELLISGRKSIEIRSWAPEYRGPMWLHAGLKRSPELEHLFGFDHLYRGGFIGLIELAAVVPITSGRWLQWRDKHLDQGEYRSGLLAWIMNTAQRFEAPVQAKGQLGLFYPSIEVVQQLRKNALAFRQAKSCSFRGPKGEIAPES